ncbi:MAG TPA: ATP-binding protein [Polyangiaceae bacterium]|nr:ATP-binding protein [Polyangiaceae bacterium]
MTAHVLFVDDDEANLIVWREACSDAHAVLVANGADHAMALLREHEVGVVLADQRMPKTTGVELLEKVREEFPDTVRILITAYSDLGAAIDAINRGHVRRYLRKPCALPELRAEIADAMEFYQIRLRARAVERRLLLTERVYALGLVASALGRELGRPAELIRESVSLARTEVRTIADKLESPAGDVRVLRTRLLELEEWLGRALLGVERVIDLARSVEVSPPGAETEQVDVASVLRLTLRIIRGELRRGADVELDLTAVSKARGSSTKLGQVVLNLLVNSLEAVSTMPPSKSVITVKLWESSGRVRLDVRDNGPSIPEAELQHVFDPFRVAGTVRGAGLGLAIARTLVEEMRGTLSVGNQPDGGVVFSVSLAAAG